MRFLGITVIGTGAVAIVLLGQGPLRARVRVALSVGLLSAVPIVLWSSHDALAAPGGAGALSFHPPDATRLFRGVAYQWLTGRVLTAGGVSAYLALAAITATIAAVTIVVIVRPESLVPDARPIDVSVARVSMLFVAIYIIGLMLTMTFLHDAPPRARYLDEVFPIVLVAVVVVLCRVTNVATSRPAHLAAIAGVLAVGMATCWWHVDAQSPLWKTRRTKATGTLQPPGEGYAALRGLPVGDLIFADFPDLMWRYAGRSAIALPPRQSIWTGKLNRRYGTDVTEIGTLLCRRSGVLFVTTTPLAAFRARVLSTEAHLAVAARYPDGFILRATGPGCRTEPASHHATTSG